MATRAEIDDVMSKIILSDRQKKIFEICCIRRLGIYFAADETAVCPFVVNKELRIIKAKIFAVLK